MNPAATGDRDSFRTTMTTTTTRRRAAAIPLGALLLGTLAACSERPLDREYTEVRKRAVAEPAVLAATSEMRFGSMPSSENRPAGSQDPADPSRFVWDTPEGWTELEPTSFRTANFQVEGDPEAECYMTVLPGMGGGLESNVNRWRGQMGLPPMASEEIAALPSIKLFGNDATLVELTGEFTGMGDVSRPDSRMLGGILSMEQGTLFVKFTGPDELVQRNRDAFFAFCRSLDVILGSNGPAGASGADGHEGHDEHDGHDHSAHAADDGAPAGGTAGSAGGLAFDVPEGWVQEGPRSMRLASFRVGPDGEGDCGVTVLGGGAGGVAANVNRWRGQVGEEPLSEAEIEALPTVDIFGVPSPWMEAYGDYSGMGSDDLEGAGLLGAICSLGDQTLFVKLIGPAEVLREERDRFLAFCESLRAE